MNITHRASIWSGITTAANNELCCRHSLSEVYCVTVLSKWQLNANTKRSRMWCEDAVSAQSQCTSGKSPSPNEGISDSQRPSKQPISLHGQNFKLSSLPVAYPGILFGGGGVQQIQMRTEDRQNGGIWDGSPIVRGSGSSCNLVQEISFPVVKFS